MYLQLFLKIIIIVIIIVILMIIAFKNSFNLAYLQLFQKLITLIKIRFFMIAFMVSRQLFLKLITIIIINLNLFLYSFSRSFNLIYYFNQHNCSLNCYQYIFLLFTNSINYAFLFIHSLLNFFPHFLFILDFLTNIIKFPGYHFISYYFNFISLTFYQ